MLVCTYLQIAEMNYHYLHTSLTRQINVLEDSRALIREVVAGPS